MPLSHEILDLLSDRHSLKYFCQDGIMEKLHQKSSEAFESTDLQKRYLLLSYIYNTPNLDSQLNHDTQILLKLTNSKTLNDLHAKISNLQNERHYIVQSIKKSLESIILAQGSLSPQAMKDLVEMYNSVIVPSLENYSSAQEKYLMTVCSSLYEKSRLLQAQITANTYDGDVGGKALQMRYILSIMILKLF